jgi:flavin reductase (DIM6/NTAB) family NADH-FMN oxidoreductase RutF
VVFPYGDHTIIIGEVGDVEIQAGEPMVYYRRRLTWRLG